MNIFKKLFNRISKKNALAKNSIPTVSEAHAFIYKYDAMANKSNTGYIPFNDENQSGDFIYISNREKERYSYLYNELDINEAFNNCNISMGYAALFVCKRIAFFKGEDKISYYRYKKKGESQDRRSDKAKYFIFQDPFTKYKGYDNYYDDVVGVFTDKNEAIENAKKLVEEEKFSVLVAKVKDSCGWH